jgi:hypothetical protein
MATLTVAALGFAQAALGASPERFPLTGPHRICPYVKVPAIYPGYPPNANGPQEIDLFGHGWPSCGTADHLLRVAPARIPEHHWGRFNGWLCVWELAWEECKRGGVRVYAANPGD